MILLAPEQDDDTTLSWEVQGTWVRARRSSNGWHVDRSWAHDGIELVETPSLIARFGESEAVAYLENPLVLSVRQRVELWLTWPLELALLSGGKVVETSRPGTRSTVLGTVEEGRVLPAFTSTALAAPAPPRITAAVRVSVVNRGQEPTMLRRIPAQELALDVFQIGETLVAGTQEIRIVENARAEASAQPLSTPAGAQLVRKGTVPQQRAGLQWLLDSTRRSTEFQL